MKMYNRLVMLMCLFSLNGHAQNLVSSESWTIGSGSVGIFDDLGTAAENIREIGTGPHGDQTILWKAVPDAGGNQSGGWDTGFFPIDRTKMYRFSIWIKKTNSMDGMTYFGCRSNDVLNLGGTVNTNAYFFASDLPALGKWYLLVGYIHASGDASTTHYGGIYDGVTGEKVVALTDFKFNSTATNAMHRAYLYSDVNTSDRQYFYGPEVYQVATNQPLSEFNTSAIFNGDAYFSKKLGIGTANPSNKLQVNSARAVDRIAIQGSLANSNIGFMVMNQDGTERWSMANVYDRDYFQFYRAGYGNVMVLGDNGNVGIGTTAPSQKLTVNGTVYGKEVKVDLSVPGPDYVFEKDYSLPSLAELQRFIGQHKHLPEVPSAAEMEENGVELGVMNMLLLKKIEELTLYVIELKKENQRQDEVIQQLQNK